MGNEGSPQGAMVGDNPVAQEVYERLAAGMPAYATAPQGVPPIGGPNTPTPSELVSRTVSVPAQVAGGLAGLKAEIVGLRQDIRDLKQVLQSL